MIPCDVIARLAGYPHGYAVAERRLAATGYFYLIEWDAWAPLEMARAVRSPRLLLAA